MKISCCMIVKNEEEVLDETLRSACSFFDEIVVVDTGSTDSTVDIAKKYTDKIFFLDWAGDFSAARNFSIEKACNDFVFILDADEQLTQFDSNQVKSVFTDEKNIGRIKRRNNIQNGQVFVERIKRLFNRNYYRYDGIIHEQVVPVSIICGEPVNLAVQMDHTGYLSEAMGRTEKLDRNIKLLKQAISLNGRDPYLYYQLGKSYGLKKDLQEARECYERSIELVHNIRYEYVLDLVISYGYNLINLGQYSQALMLEKYADAMGQQADFCFLMAYIYMNNYILDKAVQWFEKCTIMEEGHIEGINSYLPAYNIGVIYECLGCKEEAVSWYLKCGNYSVAQNRLQQLEGNY